METTSSEANKTEEIFYTAVLIENSSTELILQA